MPAAVALLGGLVLSTCRPDSAQMEAREADQVVAAAAHAHHADTPMSSAPSERSLYRLPASWTDQHGDTLELADLAGSPVVMAMVYTHCTFACPRILAQMKRIEGALGEGGAPASSGAESGRGDVRFVLVSIDPDRDTPDRLADFAESTRLDPARWTLLNGADRDVRALSVLLGVKYRATGGGDFAHSNVLTVLDRGGEIIHRVEGLNAHLEEAVSILSHLLTAPRMAAPPAEHLSEGS